MMFLDGVAAGVIGDKREGEALIGVEIETQNYREDVPNPSDPHIHCGYNCLAATGYPKRGISKVGARCHAHRIQPIRVLGDQRNRERKCQTSPPKCETIYSTQPRWSPEPRLTRRRCTSPSHFPAPELSPELSSAYVTCPHDLVLDVQQAVDAAVCDALQGRARPMATQ